MKQINASLFIKQGGYTVGGFAFDLVLSESHSLEARVAEHPIETGSAVATHIHNVLRSGELEGLISNWSVNAFTSGFDTAVKNFQGLAAGPNRARNFFQEVLKDIWANKKLVTIVLGLDTYENCVITRVDAPRDADSGDAQQFRISFKEIKRVTLATTKINASTSPLNMDTGDNRQASGNYDAGKQ